MRHPRSSIDPNKLNWHQQIETCAYDFLEDIDWIDYLPIEENSTDQSITLKYLPNSALRLALISLLNIIPVATKVGCVATVFISENNTKCPLKEFSYIRTLIKQATDLPAILSLTEMSHPCFDSLK